MVNGRTESGNSGRTQDPRFASVEQGDDHLDITSPCVDAGAPQPNVPSDMDGEPGLMGAGIDIGADEVVQPVCGTLASGGSQPAALLACMVLILGAPPAFLFGLRSSFGGR